MKVCFIGICGHVWQARKILRERDDTVICGIAPGSAHEISVADFAPDVPFYEDWRVMLDEIRPELAVVSPVFGLTSEVIVECASRGISVFSEKPVATTQAELSRVEKAIKDNGVRFCAMHYLRYTPAFYHGAQLVRNGEIGEVRMVTAQKSYKYGTRPQWYGDRTLYGGTIPWVGIHAIDWIYHFTGKRFLSVTSQSVGKDPEMAAVCQFRMEDGIIGSVNLDYYRPKSAPTHGDDRIRCVGTKGIVEVREDKIFLMNGQDCTVICPTDAPELLEEFIDGKEAIPPEEIFYLTKVAIAARDSADLQKIIDIEV